MGLKMKFHISKNNQLKPFKIIEINLKFNNDRKQSIIFNKIKYEEQNNRIIYHLSDVNYKDMGVINSPTKLLNSIIHCSSVNILTDETNNLKYKIKVNFNLIGVEITKKVIIEN